MKRLLLILLVALYSLSATGTSLYMHYCCGKLAGVDWMPRPATECPATDHAVTTACCADAVLHFSINDSHAPAAALVLPQCGQPIFPLSRLALLQLPVAPVAPPNRAHAPPLVPQAPLLAFICVFRI